MKPTSTLFYSIILVVSFFTASSTADAQQYKLRQSSSMSGMKSETTIYVKASRKRTEGGGYMGQNANIVTIEQCDLQRTIRINDRKKLYIIEPFAKDNEEIIDEDSKPAAKAKPVAAASKQTEKINGGVIHTWHNITDTGERKKMYGFTARHVWTTQKIKPSADACMMKDSMIIKTDGWYIDLPQFNCPVNSSSRSANSYGAQQPSCTDRFVSHRSGKGKLGFPLMETKTMIMGGSMQSNQFETSLETLELSTTKLDSMLFEIPLGYKEAASAEELQDKMDVNEILKQASYKNTGNRNESTPLSETKTTGKIRVGVYAPKTGEQLQAAELQQLAAGSLTNGNIEAVAIASESDAKKYNCDYVLSAEFTRVKQASKVGSFLKAIKNTDPTATSAYNIEATLVLTKLSTGTASKQNVSGKYDGKPEDAAGKAIEEGLGLLLKGLK
jgi:hypothetical protein